MDSPLWTLVSALLFYFIAPIVESQGNSNPRLSPPPQSPKSPPPPPALYSPPLSRSQSSPPPRKPPPSRKPPMPSPHSRRYLRPPPPHNADVNIYHPPPKEKKLNTGKKVGLMFIGFATILQVCVVAFLLIRRKQLFGAEDVY